ncbi:uncharacterized protein LOC142176579 [Nicotiana tabacum]|uniref:Uncharacterized protein LOC142176579 n=2 Tax=Nicotiana tabacum TaxID=4097 RepID=A0AC58TTX5_TOBAC
MQISKRRKGKKRQHVIPISKEIVIEILRRVPCQDLTENLKKVCMEWCSIIYSGSFAYSQIEHRILKSSSSFSQMEAVVITLADDQHSQVIVSSLEWHSNQNHSFQDLKTKDLYTTKDVLVQTWLPMPRRRIMRVNPVNGFVCFWSTTDHSRFHIFNPVTKEHVTTPTNTYLGKNMNDDPSAVGLGICPLSYEYKVVVLDNTESGKIKPSIFTIGKDYLWRSLKEIPHHILAEVQTVAYVKGVLYWYTKTCTSAHYLTTYQIKTTKTLICFDVTKEEFDMIVVSFESLKKQVISIAEKGGRLCLVIINYGPICSLLIEVYVAHNINDLSSLNSWKKELTVTAPSIAYNLELEFVHIIIVTDEILVIQLDERGVGFFDVATGKLLGLYYVPFQGTAIPYVPSLVALRHRPLLASSS